MMRAIQVNEHGGPEVLTPAEVPDPIPGRGQAVVRIEAAGVNFVDVYHRIGLYPNDLPFIIGQEGAGVVVAVGEGTSGVAEGDRVAFTGVPGAYAEQISVDAERLVPVPEAIETRTAAALMLQGMTAHYLAHDTYRLGPDSRCLIHAGAGGVGRLLIQFAKRLGATVLATVGTREKATLALEAGADHAIVYTEVDFVEASRQILGDDRLDVVYDSVGIDTFLPGLDLLKPRGLMALYGQSSGPVAPLDLRILNVKGSLYVTRPSLGAYLATREELLWRAGEVMDAVANGDVQVHIDSTYPLAQAAAAHAALESRATSGKLLLLP